MNEFQLKGRISSRDALLKQVSQEQFKSTNTYAAEYYGTCSYTYTGAKHPAKEFPQYLSDLAKETEEYLNLPVGYFNMVLINRYPSGKGLGKHKDNEPEITPLSVIASLSLGEPRDFCIWKGYNNLVETINLKHGDLVVMSGRSQMDYYHSVTPGEGIRYNLTFRHNENAPVRP